MIPTKATVFLDYKCNFACDHCSVGSSPETEFEMPEELCERTFQEIQSVPAIKSIVFTGGEVTLHKDRLLRYLNKSSENGYQTRIVTNGWWAHDMESAREMATELADAGLTEINTSYDDFHTDYMDFENILNLIEASLETDMQNVVVACIIGDEDPEWDLDRVIRRIEERIGKPPEEIPRLKLIDDAAAPFGSGVQLDPAAYSAQNALDVGCDDVISTFSMHPDGSVKVCCGHAQFYRPDLTMGNIKDRPLNEILADGQTNLVYWLIHEVGPKNLIDRLDVDPEIDYTGICHACGDLLGEYREEFFEYVENNKEELIHEDIFLSDRIDSQLQRLVDNRERILEQLEAVEEEFADNNRVSAD